MKSFKINCVLISTIIFWASAFIGIKIGLTDYSPGSLALLRFLVASVCIAIIYKSLRIKKTIPWSDRLLLMVSGMAGIGIYNVCLNYGEVNVSAGIASFVIGLMPIITILLSIVFLKEKQGKGVWTGILISLSGLSLLALWEGFHAHMATGIALILISALTGSILTIVQKRFAKNYHPVAIISWVIWGGTLSLLMFLPSLFREIQMASIHSTLAAVYMGVFPGAIAYLAWGMVLQTVSASKTSLSLYALPIFSTLLGFVFLNEQPSFISFLGGTIALTGAIIAHYYQKLEATTSTLDNTLAAT